MEGQKCDEGRVSLVGCGHRRENRREGRNYDQVVSGFLEPADWLLLEILYRLPVKSIFRFKCVSKVWLSVISNPFFARSYTSRRITDRRSCYAPPWTLLFHYCFDENSKIPPEQIRLQVVFKELPYPEFQSPSFTLQFLAAATEKEGQKAPMEVLAVSNGLLLSCATRIYQEIYYVCNPLTKNWVALPKPQRIRQWLGFGFVVEPDDGSYQVVRIVIEFRGGGSSRNADNFEVNFEVFSSKTGEWRDKRLFTDSSVSTWVMPPSAVSYNGILHWMESESHNRIITYASESDDTCHCRLIDMPKDRGEFRRGVLGVSQDSLGYFQTIVSCNLSVWVLENYDTGHWSLAYRIGLSEVLYPNPQLNNGLDLLPVAIHPLNSHIVYVMCWSWTSPSTFLATFNFRTRRLELVKFDIPPAARNRKVFPLVLPPWPTPVTQTSWKAV